MVINTFFESKNYSNMKTNYILAALAVVALASCSKSEIVDQNPTTKDQPIAFTNYTGATTRATVLDATGLQTPGFGVYVIKNSESTLFMDNVNPKGASWDYSDLKYWPKDEANNKLNFYFYAPHSGSTANIAAPVFTSAGDKTVAFTVNSTIADQTDFLWAAPQANLVYSGLGAEKKVNVAFNHALSRIGFTTQRDAEYSGVTIKVNSVKIKGDFNTSGTLDLTKNTAATVWKSVTPVADTEYAPAIQNNTNITTDAVQLNTDAQYIMVVPSTSEAKTTYTITVDYDVTSGGVTTNNVITSAAESLAFEIGKAYTFNIKIGLNAILFTAEVAAWDVQTAADKTLK